QLLRQRLARLRCVLEVSAFEVEHRPRVTDALERQRGVLGRVGEDGEQRQEVSTAERIDDGGGIAFLEQAREPWPGLGEEAVLPGPARPVELLAVLPADFGVERVGDGLSAARGERVERDD